jgi:hypothetical protein
MTLIKSLMLAVIITLLLTYTMGASLLDWLAIEVTMNHQLLEPMQAISTAAVIVVILVVLLLVIAFSVFGLLMFSAFIAAGAMLMLSFSFLWPIIIIAAIVWLVTDKRCSV